MSDNNKREFSIADLVPEPITFRDTEAGGEDKVYDVLPGEAMGPVALARFNHLAKRVSAIQYGTNATPEEAAELERIVDEFMATLIPTLPQGRIEALAFKHKYAFLMWWKQNATGDRVQGAPSANPTTRRNTPPPPKHRRRRG